VETKTKIKRGLTENHADLQGSSLIKTFLHPKKNTRDRIPSRIIPTFHVLGCHSKYSLIPTKCIVPEWVIWLFIPATIQ
jgi:hypothetical protein